MPASLNGIAADAAVRDYSGDVWYQRTVRVPRGWAGQRMVLHFESATHRATVWVDDTEVMNDEGGYTPFEADITGLVTAGNEVRVTVCVNNTLSFQSMSPGVIEDTPAGPRQRYWHDFFNYAGLHRSIWLCATPHAHTDDVTVVTGLDGLTGTVDCSVTAVGAEGLSVRALLHNAEGHEVASASGAYGTLTVDDVHRWALGHGYLYVLEGSARRRNGHRRRLL